MGESFFASRLRTGQRLDLRGGEDNVNVVFLDEVSLEPSHFGELPLAMVTWFIPPFDVLPIEYRTQRMQQHFSVCCLSPSAVCGSEVMSVTQVGSFERATFEMSEAPVSIPLDELAQMATENVEIGLDYRRCASESLASLLQ